MYLKGQSKTPSSSLPWWTTTVGLPPISFNGDSSDICCQWYSVAGSQTVCSIGIIGFECHLWYSWSHPPPWSPSNQGWLGEGCSQLDLFIFIRSHSKCLNRWSQIPSTYISLGSHPRVNLRSHLLYHLYSTLWGHCQKIQHHVSSLRWWHPSVFNVWPKYPGWQKSNILTMESCISESNHGCCLTNWNWMMEKLNFCFSIHIITGLMIQTPPSRSEVT